ncbi:MAG: hypothetical protein R6V16_01855 [Bacteroidales bacterium]
MDHIVYLDAKAKELDRLRSGEKDMIIRGAMGRKMPYGKVFAGDVLFFVENKGDSLVKAKARVDNVFTSDKLSREESLQIVQEHQDRLWLNESMNKRFAGKRYLTLITVIDFFLLDPFPIDRSAYGNMDDWLPVEKIDTVRM